MLIPAGISSKGRMDLAKALTNSNRFLTPKGVAQALEIDNETAARMLSAWSKSGWVRRVRRGIYIGVPIEARNPATWSDDALIVATEVWSPCYFSGWTAARHWSLTEQVFRPTIVKTSNRVRVSKTKLLNHDYLVSHVGLEFLRWGLKKEWVGDVQVNFTDPTRTIIEIMDNPSIGGGIRHSAEILAAYLEENDPRQLIKYGDVFGNRTVFKRLGYLLEALNVDCPDVIEQCKKKISAGYSPLDPGSESDGNRIARWRLLANAPVGIEEPS